MLISLFLVILLYFLFVPCGRLSWLSISILLHVKYTLSYRIVFRFVGCDRQQTWDFIEVERLKIAKNFRYFIEIQNRWT